MTLLYTNVTESPVFNWREVKLSAREGRQGGLT
jgi:hypothetical protein